MLQCVAFRQTAMTILLSRLPPLLSMVQVLRKSIIAARVFRC